VSVDYQLKLWPKYCNFDFSQKTACRLQLLYMVLSY